MNKRFLVSSVGIMAVALIAVGNNAFAQQQQRSPGGGGWQGFMGRNMANPASAHTMKVSSQGVFALVGSILIKCNATTLKQVDMIQLLDNEANESNDAQSGQPNQMATPQPSAALLLTPGDTNKCVLVVIGDDFINVDADTMQINARGKLPTLPVTTLTMRPAAHTPRQAAEGSDSGSADMPAPPAPRQNAEGMDSGSTDTPRPPSQPRQIVLPQGAPDLELLGDTLYVQRSSQIVAINIKYGKLMALTELPKPAAQTNGNQ